MWSFAAWSKQKSAALEIPVLTTLDMRAARLRGGFGKRFPHFRDGLGIEAGCR
jgi:hypothetical protein